MGLCSAVPHGAMCQNTVVAPRPSSRLMGCLRSLLHRPGWSRACPPCALPSSSASTLQECSGLTGVALPLRLAWHGSSRAHKGLIIPVPKWLQMCWNDWGDRKCCYSHSHWSVQLLPPRHQAGRASSGGSPPKPGGESGMQFSPHLPADSWDRPRAEWAQGSCAPGLGAALAARTAGEVGTRAAHCHRTGGLWVGPSGMPSPRTPGAHHLLR